MSPPVVHFEACVAEPNLWAFLHSFVSLRPNFWPFLRSFVRRRLKNWICVGDRITGLFPCMAMRMIYFSSETAKEIKLYLRYNCSV